MTIILGLIKSSRILLNLKVFRWKQLTNDKVTGKRFIVFLLRRPEDIPNKLVKK